MPKISNPKYGIKFAEEGGAAGITSVGIGKNKHVLQELEQRLDLLAFLDIVQPDYQLLQSLLLLFLLAALRAATGHGAAGTAGEPGRWLAALGTAPPPPLQAQPSASGRAQTATVAAPAQPQPGLPSRRAALGTPPGKSESCHPRSKNSKGALGKEDTAQLAPFGGWKMVSLRVPPIGRGVIFPQRMQLLTIKIGQLHRLFGDDCGFCCCGGRHELFAC